MVETEVPISIHYLPGSPQLEMTERGDWVDLYVYNDITLTEGEQTYISMGVSMALPHGYEAIMAPRSSTFKRWGILQTNGIGVIDNSYCGTDDIWMMPVLATKSVTIPKGTRLCQFRIQQKQPKLIFKRCDFLGTVNRGGLGSSGV